MSAAQPARRRRHPVLLAVLVALLLAAGCASTTVGSGQPASSAHIPNPCGGFVAPLGQPGGLLCTPPPSSTVPPTTVPPTTVPPSTVCLVTCPPTGPSAPSTPPAGPDVSSFVGDWIGHSRSLSVTRDGTGIVLYRAYKDCSEDPTPPCDQTTSNGITSGGRVTFTITAVAGDVATAAIDTSNDPAHQGSFTLTRTGPVIDTAFGSFCGLNAPAGTCGA